MHWDTLDMRLWAHGICMSPDAGQRSGYGEPNHRCSRVHNVLEVDGKDWYGHSWVENLFDAPGAHYLRAASMAPQGMEHVTLFQRQVSLIDVDEGRNADPTLEQDSAKVVTPSSYVFDVFRASGGKTYTYCFHGSVDDQFTATVKNRKDLTGGKGDPDEEYMNGFTYRAAIEGVPPEDVEWAADCDGDVLEATWRVARWKTYSNRPEADMYGGKYAAAMTPPRRSASRRSGCGSGDTPLCSPTYSEDRGT